MKVVMWRRFSYALAFVAVAAIAVFAKDVRTIQMRDDCDPATFNAALNDPEAPPGTPDACVGDGDTTFADFLDEFFSTGSVEKWRFNSSRTDADRAVKAENRGGETHTFTPVDHFGGGFVEVLNLGQEPLTECARRDANGVLVRDKKGNLVPAFSAFPTFVPPGHSGATIPLDKGTHKFQCCIHPWMRATIRVE